MSEAMTKARRNACGLSGCILALLVLLTGCDSGSYNVRYRLAFAVEVNGQIRTASSIINIFYYGGGTSGPSGRASYSKVTGVAPVIDLGSYGWLVAAMESNGEEFYRRKRLYQLKCKPPRGAAALPGAFGVHASELVRMRQGQRELADDNYPGFIWFPKGAPYTMAQQLCPEEFPEVMPGDVKFKSISIDLAPDAQLRAQLELKAPWLDELRVDQLKSWPGEIRYKQRASPNFIPNLRHQFENPGIKP